MAISNRSSDSFSIGVLVYGSIILITLTVIILALFTDFFANLDEAVIPQPVWFLGAVTLLITAIIALSKLIRTLEAAENNAARIEKIADALEKLRSETARIEHNTRLTESAKAIAFRDAERQSFREVVLERLQHKDFETTSEIIEEISQSRYHHKFAEQLRKEAEKYKTSPDQQRIDQVITHIDKLLENYQWAKASRLIESLIENYPDSQKALSMRQKMLDNKGERKKVLLTAWDDAVKRQATDRSLEILRELDSYLTPNEGLALQEAAKDVFRTKLHNLGVRFSLAVSAKQWQNAVDTGRQIMQEFPNSRMAQEIREKFHVLKTKTQNPPTAGKQNP